MELNKLYKFVFEDDRIKILKGYLIREDEFIYEVRGLGTNEIVSIGKRAVIKVNSVVE